TPIVIDVFIQVPRQYLPLIQDGDPAFCDVPADRRRRQPRLPHIIARTLEPRIVVCLGVGDVDLSVGWIHHYVEENRSYPAEVAVGAELLSRNVCARVDSENILVGQVEPQLVVPDDVALVEPVHLAVDWTLTELDDQARARRGNVLEIV